MLLSTALARLVRVTVHTVEASEVTQWSTCDSQAAFKRYLRIQLSSRNSMCNTAQRFTCKKIQHKTHNSYTNINTTVRTTQKTKNFWWWWLEAGGEAGGGTLGFFIHAYEDNSMNRE